MANYVQNRLPWKSIQVIPYEGWFGQKGRIFVISGHLDQIVMSTSMQKSDKN